MSRVWDESPYDGKTLLVHLAMADFANDEGVAFPSQTTLARKARSTPEWVRKCLLRFEADGFVEKLAESGGRGVPARWGLAWPNSVGGDSETPNSAAAKPPTPARETPNSPCLPSLDEPREPSERTVSDLGSSPAALFLDFWALYPSARRIDKPTSQTRFVKAMKDDPETDIIGGLRRWLAHWEGVDPQFVPQSTTWLNQRRWETDPGPPNTSANRAKVGPSHAAKASGWDDYAGPTGIVKL